MQTRKHDPAFPIYDSEGSYFVRNEGLSKREFFAICILQGIVSNSDYSLTKYSAKQAVNLADLLIIELNKTSCEKKMNGEDQGDE